MAALDSLVLVVVDTETSTVFAHACKMKGADADILDTLMEDIERVQERPRDSSQGSKGKEAKKRKRERTSCERNRRSKEKKPKNKWEAWYVTM